MNYNAAWFLSSRFGRPFALAEVDLVVVDDAILEASYWAEVQNSLCHCPSKYPMVLQIATAMILYSDGEPQNTAAGEIVQPIAGTQKKNKSAYVESDKVGPLERRYKLYDEESKGSSIPELKDRLSRLLANCKPLKKAGLYSLSTLSKPKTNCSNNSGTGRQFGDISIEGRGYFPRNSGGW